jgi:large subunit ribosomal protein L17
VHQSIKTTRVKAKAVKPLIDKLISIAKQNTLAVRRQAYRILGDHKLVSLLFSDIAPRFNNKIGGYTRILNLGKRRGDDAQLVILELTEIKKSQIKKPKKEKEVKTQEVETKPEAAEEKPIEEKKPRVTTIPRERPSVTKKPTKTFLGGLRRIFKKERDSL